MCMWLRSVNMCVCCVSQMNAHKKNLLLFFLCRSKIWHRNYWYEWKSWKTWLHSPKKKCIGGNQFHMKQRPPWKWEKKRQNRIYMLRCLCFTEIYQNRGHMSINALEIFYVIWKQSNLCCFFSSFLQLFTYANKYRAWTMSSHLFDYVIWRYFIEDLCTIHAYMRRRMR